MYLTVKEASELSGKSPTTIYRLCNKRRNSEFIRKEDNKFFIDRDFLLATYPQHEKLISHEIEYGKVEITEPVFLEIEPKKEEVFSRSETGNEKKLEIKEADLPSETFVDQELSVEAEIPEQEEQNEPTTIHQENEEIESKNIEQTQEFSPFAENKEIMAIPTYEKLTNPSIPDERIPFYKSRDFWERFIGIAIISIAMFFLLFLFYLSSN